MPSAIVTVSTLTSGYTFTQLANAAQAAMVSAGFSTPYDTIVSASGDIRVYAQQVNVGATKSTVYLAVNSTLSGSMYIGQTLYDNWSLSTHTGLNGLQQASWHTYTANSYSLEFTAINHPEHRTVYIKENGTLRGCLGYIRPANPPDWWDENAYLYAFGHYGYNPYATGGISSIGYFANPNPFAFNIASQNVLATYNRLYNATKAGNGKAIRRDVIQAPHLFVNSSGNSCIVGKFSDDLVSGAGSGMNIFESFTGSSSSFMLLETNSDPWSSLAIKV